MIAANVLAARLTVLYGPSGVGKSSVLNAGVARQLRELPGAAAGRPLLELVRAPARALPSRSRGRGVARAPVGSWTVPRQEAAGCTRRSSSSSTRPKSSSSTTRTAFVEEFPELVNRPDLRVNVLLSVRDDALSRLDAFKSRIPDVLGNYLRLDRLSATRAAMPSSSRSSRGPPWRTERERSMSSRDSWRSCSTKSEPAASTRGWAGEGPPKTWPVRASKRRTSNWSCNCVGRGTPRPVPAAPTADCSSASAGRERSLPSTSNCDRRAVWARERDIAGRLFNHLVTPSGSKVAHRVSDLAEYAGVSLGEVMPVVDRLTDGRILRTVARDEQGEPGYEIFHDVLAGAVLAWRTKHQADRILERERGEARRRHRRLAIVAAAACAALAVMTALTVYSFALRGQARDREADALANALQANSATLIGTDPELAMLLAREAARLRPTAATENTLRRALWRSHLREVVQSERQSQTSLPCRMAGSRSRSTTGGSSRETPRAASRHSSAAVRGPRAGSRTRTR